ncbi:MAG TPA: sigma-70 family RNA polymerase sigma factor [Planctomycetota bacterium]|nr:sigma-70 family RNA polymerase sigma factor [Planctomycetota bacterium]
MTPLPVDDLQRLLAEAPFVRALARQLVVGDADEVVQQTWLLAIEQGGQRIDRPRSWLARIARNVAANLRRGDRRRERRQRELAPSGLVPSSVELLEREERRRALVAAVDALPPGLRTVVLLRWFEGLPPRRIAALLDVPAATVSTQLQRGLERLRLQLDAEHGGDRRAWLLPLVPFAAMPVAPVSPTPVAPLLVGGAIVMTAKTKFAVAAALLVVGGVWFCWPRENEPASPPPAVPSASLPVEAHAEVERAAAPVATAREVVERTAPAIGVAAAATGSLVVHVRYGDDHAPAADRLVMLSPRGGDRRFDALRQRTDGAGLVRFDGLAPGRWTAASMNETMKRADVVAGETQDLELELEAGLTLRGIVVDPAHAPVAGALVEASPMAMADAFPEVVAVAGADGRFSARACSSLCLVGARADGYAASSVRFLTGKSGNSAEVELVLGASGGTVDGTVVDAAGRPVAGAVVVVGAGKLSGIGGRDHLPPFPALVRSDTDGRFRAVGVPAGEQPARARAPGFAPWTGSCDVAAGTAVPLRIELAAGATVRGVVLDAEGRPASGADVEYGDWDDLAHCRAVSAVDGAFAFRGLPAGDLELRARHDELGRATQRVHTEAGGAVGCELRLSRGLELIGRVLDADEQPVPNVMLECIARGGWFAIVRSDAQGRFAASNCPEQGTIGVTVRARGFEELRQDGVDPRAGELVLHVRRAEPPSARIAGTVVDPDGRPAANVSVGAQCAGRNDRAGFAATDNDGRFELGPVAPGTWSVYVRTPDYVPFTSERRELAADATWDLGTITLARGGTGQVHLVGEPIAGATYYVVDTGAARTWTVGEVGGEARTSALAPGDYLLLVSGEGIAGQAVPFTIRAGEVTTIDVRLARGVEQRVVIEGGDGGVVTGGAMLRVFRGDQLVARAWAERRGDGPATGTVCLAPGDYRLTATAGERRGEATFGVGAEPGAEVHVAVR